MVSYDISKVWLFLPTLVQALPATLALMVLTTVFGSAFGLVLTWAQVSEDKVGAGLAKGYVFTLRCTPPIVLLFLVFYGLPQFLNWWLGIDIDHWSKFVFVLVAMFLLFAAMISEVFKAAYLAIPKGQMEAGRSLGLTWGQTMRYIIMPQAFKAIIPPLGNEFIAMLKDSSLVSVIGFEELMRRGQLIIAKTYAATEIWGTVAIIYLCMTIPISRLVAYLERKYNVK